MKTLGKRALLQCGDGLRHQCPLLLQKHNLRALNGWHSWLLDGTQRLPIPHQESLACSGSVLLLVH